MRRVVLLILLCSVVFSVGCGAHKMCLSHCNDDCFTAGEKAKVLLLGPFYSLYLTQQEDKRACFDGCRVQCQDVKDEGR